MSRQLHRLKEAVGFPGTTIWIAPFSIGLYQRLRGPYVLFELPTPEENEDVLYLENTRGDMVVRDEFAEAATYLEAFWKMEQIASKGAAAIEFIERAMSRISNE